MSKIDQTVVKEYAVRCERGFVVFGNGYNLNVVSGPIPTPSIENIKDAETMAERAEGLFHRMGCPEIAKSVEIVERDREVLTTLSEWKPVQ